MQAIGLMSGTSADGIDAALVQIDGEPGNFRIALEGFVCVPYDAPTRAAILDLCRPDAPVQRVAAMNAVLGERFADAAKLLCQEQGVALSEIAYIASHGQTIWHQAALFEIAGQTVRATLQIGEPAVIAARTGCTVVADFRPADVAVGGQGAPLVPFADFALFSSPTETRAVQNIGGIANVTYLKAGGTLADVIAFDTGPGNVLIDAVVANCWREMQFDANGELAAQGTVSLPLLEWLLAHPLYRQPPPRTTGREQFGFEYVRSLVKVCDREEIPLLDRVATVTLLTAITIALAYRDWLEPKGKIQTVIVGGGGTKNQTLMRMLQDCLTDVALKTHEDFGINSDAKEAIAFALLGYETLHGRPSNVPSATGAKQPVLLGKIVACQGYNAHNSRQG